MEYDDVADYVKYKTNHRILPVDVNDPLLIYMLDEEKIDIYFTVFTTDAFTNRTNKKLPIVIEDIPPYIIITPTNTTYYNPYGAMSRFIRNPDRKNRFTREIVYRMHFDPKVTKTEMNHPLFKEKLSWPSAGIDGRPDETARELEYVKANISVKDQYSGDTQPSTKRKSPLRDLTEVVSFYENNYKIPFSLIYHNHHQILTEYEYVIHNLN